MNKETMMQIEQLCLKIAAKGNIEDIVDLGNVLHENKSSELLPQLQRGLLATFYIILKNESLNKSNFSKDDKLIIVDLLGHLFTQIKLENETVFFNFYGFLLQEIYHDQTHNLKNNPEEYKLSILSCVKCLFNSTASDLTQCLYTKQNGKKICKMVYVAVEITRTEMFRNLRIEAIECLMAMFKVNSDSDYVNLELRKSVANTFSYFLPGVCLCLRNVALEDEKVGHKLIKISVKAMGKILSLLMQDYELDNGSGNYIEQAKILTLHQLHILNSNRKEDKSEKNKIEDYMQASRNPEWFNKCDQFLAKVLIGFKKLTQHPLTEIRKELSKMCYLFIRNCSRTMPTSYRFLVEILIILSEDDDHEIKDISNNGLQGVAERLSDQNLSLINRILDGFHDTFTNLPCVFNGLDEGEKIAALKLTSAYINLIGRNLQLYDGFKEFIHVILHLCEFEIDISTFEQFAVQDLDENDKSNSEIWKHLKFLNGEALRNQFQALCQKLVKRDLFEPVTDALISHYREEEEMKEAIFLMNELILALKTSEIQNKCELIKPIFYIYIDHHTCNIPLTKHEFETTLSLRTLRNNIQLVSLNVDGIGNIAEVLKEEFRPFLMKSLFLILTRAGSKQPLIQSSGRKTLANVAHGLNYPNVASLINENMDYFVFYMERRLKNNDLTEDAFNVMEVVINHGDRTTLSNLLIIVEVVLIQSCDNFKHKRMGSYLRIFKIFFKRLMRLFDITVPLIVFRTKIQRKEEMLKNFEITGLDGLEEITDFSDDIMDKSAEELYKEDMKKNNHQMEKEIMEPVVEEYKKVEPPKHVKLTIEILKRCLNFLPAKEDDRKLLVLEILKDGIEIIKSFEDELLPIVHLIWSPLVARFRDVNLPVIINFSFQLLCTLARVSKDFIRNRTAKEVMPYLLDILKKLSLESYKKDRGAAYRYTQNFKLQIVILENLAPLLGNIDLPDRDIEETMDVVFAYLSSKQPIPLQSAAVGFFKLIICYDPVFEINIRNWLKECNEDYKRNLNNIIE